MPVRTSRSRKGPERVKKASACEDISLRRRHGACEEGPRLWSFLSATTPHHEVSTRKRPRRGALQRAALEPARNKGEPAYRWTRLRFNYCRYIRYKFLHEGLPLPKCSHNRQA